MNKESKNNLFSRVDFSTTENLALIERMKSFFEGSSLEMVIISEFGHKMPSLKNLVYKKLTY